ncbi:MAG: hypothetical protein JWN14_234, partial [Chthonomonadales bacterium]|nr:hypothetical protein [Chthonomonadales bacterium]
MYCAQKNVLMAACLIFACLTSYLPAMAQLTFTEYAGPTTPMFENNLVLGDITSG